METNSMAIRSSIFVMVSCVLRENPRVQIFVSEAEVLSLLRWVGNE